MQNLRLDLVPLGCKYKMKGSYGFIFGYLKTEKRLHGFGDAEIALHIEEFLSRVLFSFSLMPLGVDTVKRCLNINLEDVVFFEQFKEIKIFKYADCGEGIL